MCAQQLRDLLVALGAAGDQTAHVATVRRIRARHLQQRQEVRLVAQVRADEAARAALPRLKQVAQRERRVAAQLRIPRVQCDEQQVAYCQMHTVTVDIRILLYALVYFCSVQVQYCVQCTLYTVQYTILSIRIQQLVQYLRTRELQMIPMRMNCIHPEIE